MVCKNWKKIGEKVGMHGKKTVFENMKTGREIIMYHGESRGGFLGNLVSGEWEVVLTGKGVMNLAENKKVLSSKTGAKKLVKKWMRRYKED